MGISYYKNGFNPSIGETITAKYITHGGISPDVFKSKYKLIKVDATPGSATYHLGNDDSNFVYEIAAPDFGGGTGGATNTDDLLNVSNVTGATTSDALENLQNQVDDVKDYVDNLPNTSTLSAKHTAGATLTTTFQQLLTFVTDVISDDVDLTLTSGAINVNKHGTLQVGVRCNVDAVGGQNRVLNLELRDGATVVATSQVSISSALTQISTILVFKVEYAVTLPKAYTLFAKDSLGSTIYSNVEYGIVMNGTTTANTPAYVEQSVVLGEGGPVGAVVMFDRILEPGWRIEMHGRSQQEEVGTLNTLVASINVIKHDDELMLWTGRTSGWQGPNRIGNTLQDAGYLTMCYARSGFSIFETVIRCSDRITTSLSRGGDIGVDEEDNSNYVTESISMFKSASATIKGLNIGTEADYISTYVCLRVYDNQNKLVPFTITYVPIIKELND